MLPSFDNGGAEKFWDQDGWIGHHHPNRKPVWTGRHDVGGRRLNTISSLTDLIRYYDMLLNGSGRPIPGAGQDCRNDLAQSTPTRIGGYPQRFDIQNGLYTEPVAVTQGRICCIDNEWMHPPTEVE
ncbi:hypothetical protein [Mycobacterium lepromatosis]|uniref:hypothetical protein n=1 Tax=Mycobacterium lepromatosis TaxID=480418 RepID=UPI000678B79C|nr:hypothetical protein [Mycobacterium lepromatosis]